MKITAVRKMIMVDEKQNTIRTAAVLSDSDATVVAGDATVVAVSSDDDDELAAMYKGIIQWYKVM